MEDYRVTQTGDEIQEILNQSPIDTADIVELKEAATSLDGRLESVEGKIPAGASEENPLTDKQYVDDSIASASATFRGTYNEVTDLELTTEATHADIGSALDEVIELADSNDYCFVQIPTADATLTEIESIERYKFVTGTGWQYEYTLNNSGFTADQWAAINSGITSGLVAKLTDLPTNAELNTLLNGKANAVDVYTKSETYNKTELDTQLGAKANSADVYPKTDTYTKQEVNALITTPEVQYVTVTATAGTTAVTDVLPATGAANTIYRVGSWDGTQYDDGVYSEYSWNGSAYILLDVKNYGFATGSDFDNPTTAQRSLVATVGSVLDGMPEGVFDVSARNSGSTWASLSALLSDADLDTLIPASWRKGGMSIRFVQTSDNKYVQYFLTKDEWSASEDDWVNIEEDVTSLGSRCLHDDSGVHTIQIAMTLGARGTNGIIISNQARATADPILEVKDFERVVISIPSGWSINPWYVNDDNTSHSQIAEWVTGEYEIVLDGVHNIMFNAKYGNNTTITQEILDNTNWTAVKYKEPEHYYSPAASYEDFLELQALVGNIDDVPIPNSPNLVKSGGVFSAISINEEQEVSLSSSDYSNMVYNTSGSTTANDNRISTSEYLTSGNGGDLIHNAIPSAYKVFIWIRKSASRLVQFIAGDGWTTEDVQIPANTDYFITIGRLNNGSLNTSSYYAVKVVRSNLINGIEKLQDEIEDINEQLELEDLPELTQDDYANIVYNNKGQSSANNARISTKNYYSTGYNSHVLHLTAENYKLFVWYRVSADEFVVGTDWTTEDFIVPPHTDYYITIAHISNGNISTAGYYLVARHLLEKSRIINMESRIEELENAVLPDIKTPQIVFSQWNVGQFAGGAGSPNITAATYNKMVIKWNKEVFAEDADLFGMIEYNPVFGKNTSNVDVSPDDVVWNDYQFKAIFRQPQTASYWGGNAILSKIQLENQEKIKYSCYNGITAPDATTQHMIDEVAFMTVSDMIYMGVKVKVVEASVAYNATTRSDNTYQRMVYQELVTRFGNEPFVIIAGDMECVNRTDYDIFTDAGFTLCNGGDFGWFNTCVTPLVSGVTELDNIIVKGFDVKDVKVSLSGLSDHYPLIASLEIVEPS